MTTAQYITLGIISVIAYWAGLEAQLRRQQDFQNHKIKTDYFYPITTGFRIVWLGIVYFVAMVFLMLGIKIPFVKRNDRGLDNLPHFAETTLGAFAVLLYYPITFVVFYLYGDFNIWLASPVALVILCLINQGYGYLAVGFMGNKR